MSGINHLFNVYRATDILVNDCPATAKDFQDPGTIHTIEFGKDTMSTLNVVDDNCDEWLSGDNVENEIADDKWMQTSDGKMVYVDWEIVMADADGNEYTFYAIDTVGDGDPKDTYLTFDPDCPPPECVELTCVSFTQVDKIAYDDFGIPCFAEGTTLKMADGSYKAVEDIAIGDRLWTASMRTGAVLWVGSSVETDTMYQMITGHRGQPVTVTKNHGIAVKLMDGTRALAAAKFLVGADYVDFMMVPVNAGPTRVYHIMLNTHELLVTGSGIYSESYFCGGAETLPEAQAVYKLVTGREEMDLIHPRVKRKDAAEILDIRTLPDIGVAVAA